MGNKIAVSQGVTSTETDKIEVVLHRVGALLRATLQGSNHGEITVKVIAGRVYVTGGPIEEIK